jgi:glutathione peroxidase
MLQKPFGRLPLRRAADALRLRAVRGKKMFWGVYTRGGGGSMVECAVCGSGGGFLWRLRFLVGEWKGRHFRRVKQTSGKAWVRFAWERATGVQLMDEVFLMRKLLLILFLCGMVTMAGEKTVYDFTMNSIEGQPTPLSRYQGKVVLLVNVASRCGFTPQYTALEKVYETYKDRGLVIVGIPANNFGGQEPGSNQEIKTFCSTKYNVTFPMMAKVSVKGSDQAPLYQFLTSKEANPKVAGDIQWNFTKFLVGPDGHVVARFEPDVTPDSPQVIGAIEKELGAIKK